MLVTVVMLHPGNYTSILVSRLVSGVDSSNYVVFIALGICQ